MADAPVVHIGENSPEEVAYKLLKDIANIEGYALHQSPGRNQQTATRAWLLDTYLECIRAVRGMRSTRN